MSEELGVVAHPVMPALGSLRQESQFVASLGYTTSSTPAWATYPSKTLGRRRGQEWRGLKVGYQDKCTAFSSNSPPLLKHFSTNLTFPSLEDGKVGLYTQDY